MTFIVHLLSSLAGAKAGGSSEGKDGIIPGLPGGTGCFRVVASNCFSCGGGLRHQLPRSRDDSNSWQMFTFSWLEVGFLGRVWGPLSCAPQRSLSPIEGLELDLLMRKLGPREMPLLLAGRRTRSWQSWVWCSFSQITAGDFHCTEWQWLQLH